MEVERKFLLNHIPDELESYEKKKILQGYISLNPALRIRSSGTDFIFTFKTGKGLVRDEFECPITKEQFDNLWELVLGKEIKKDRYYIPLSEGLIAELDIYHERLSGLVTVEVEFETSEQAEAFNPPMWFGEDVTNDLRYSNSNLSKILPPTLKQA